MARTSGPGDRYVGFPWLTLWSIALAACLCASGGPAHADGDLQITEIMFDPVDDNVWKWIEVHNPGSMPVDLHGAIAARLDDPNLPDATPFIDSTLTSNTIIPAGGTAVLYDAVIVTEDPNDPTPPHADYLDQVFRDAWGLSGSVPVIGVRAFPDLTATGSQGYWADFADYQDDLVSDGMGGKKVGSFNNALFGLDYSSGFPAGDGMSSIYWDGDPNNSDGGNWHLSSGGNGASTSLLTHVPGNDIGNPGIAPGGVAPTGVFITEVMYNPSPSTESTWEWIEVYNNSGMDLIFDPNGGSPHVLDDQTGGLLTSANVASGMIRNGAVGVLFNRGGLTPDQIELAWDPTGIRDINFIPVDDFPGLTNVNGEEIALWPSLGAYEDPNDPRNPENALAMLTYGVNGDWPATVNGASIYLESFDADPNEGANWSLSQADDAAGSFYISVGSTLHLGGDVGTPGFFAASPGADADFDNDGDVDGLDFLAWQRKFGTVGGLVLGPGDANGDRDVNAEDLAIWEGQYGSQPLQAVAAVPEPTCLWLAALATWASLGILRRPLGTSRK